MKALLDALKCMVLRVILADCASKPLAINLHLIFLRVYGLSNPCSKFPDYFKDTLPHNNKPRLKTIVWTTASNIVQKNGMYNCNHFCLVFIVKDKFCNIPVSHLNKESMLKDHVFHPFENTNHPFTFIDLERQSVSIICV